MKQVDQKIYEWGEIERDADRTAQFFKVGGWLYKIAKWVETCARDERLALIEERNAERAREREARI